MFFEAVQEGGICQVQLIRVLQDHAAEVLVHLREDVGVAWCEDEGRERPGGRTPIQLGFAHVRTEWNHFIYFCTYGFLE